MSFNFGSFCFLDLLFCCIYSRGICWLGLSLSVVSRDRLLEGKILPFYFMAKHSFSLHIRNGQGISDVHNVIFATLNAVFVRIRFNPKSKIFHLSGAWPTVALVCTTHFYTPATTLRDTKTNQVGANNMAICSLHPMSTQSKVLSVSSFTLRVCEWKYETKWS